MHEPVCPMCKQPAQKRETNPSFPFCSSRCKLLDLGNWLDERYRVPEPDGTRDEEPSNAEDDSDNLIH